jgi:2-octaprenyl-6-methoxyphenol hydroxylase
VAASHAQDPGAKAALSAYDRARRPDILARSSAVDMLNRSLLSTMLPAQAARAAGLSLLRVAPPLRAFFMREGLRTGGGVASLLPWR